MSIYDQIQDCVGRGSLFPWRPALPFTSPVRDIFVSKSIKDFIDGPWINDSQEQRAGHLQADLDSFIGGDNIVVSMTPTKARNAYMGLLYPTSDGVWDIRSRDPKPGIRVFGRFAEKDVFVALMWCERLPLGTANSREWRDVIEQCKTEWRNRFHAYQAICGDNVHDYLSNNFVVV